MLGVIPDLFCISIDQFVRLDDQYLIYYDLLGIYVNRAVVDAISADIVEGMVRLSSDWAQTVTNTLFIRCELD